MKDKTEKQKEMEKDKNGLNFKQELFCKHYTSHDIEMFGNGVQSYIEAYNPDNTEKGWYKTACANASRLLTKAKIIDRINNLLEIGGFNDENVEKQHLFLLNQHANLAVKSKAIDSYYKLKGKNEPDKIEIKNDYEQLSEEELIELARGREGTSKEGTSEKKA